MVVNRHSARPCRAYLCPLLLAACWTMCMPIEAGAQPAAIGTTELISRLETVHDRDFWRAPDSLAQSFGSNVQAPAPAPSPTARRDSIKNGLLIGAAVGAVLSILSSKIADCPDSAEGSCPGTKVLGIAVTVVTGAAIGAGVDLLFAVDPGPGGATRPGVRRSIFVSGRIRW